MAIRYAKALSHYDLFWYEEAGDPLEGALRNAVAHPPADLADGARRGRVAGRRSDVDDRPAAAGDHPGEEDLVQVEGAEDVGVDKGHEGVKLGEVVLHGSAREKQTAAGGTCRKGSDGLMFCRFWRSA